MTSYYPDDMPAIAAWALERGLTLPSPRLERVMSKESDKLTPEELVATDDDGVIHLFELLKETKLYAGHPLVSVDVLRKAIEKKLFDPAAVRGGESQTLLHAICSDSWSMTEAHEFLLKWFYDHSPATFAQKDGDGCTPLLAACSAGRVDVVKMMLELDRSGLSASKGDSKQPERKHESKAAATTIDFNARCQNGSTALHCLLDSQVCSVVVPCWF